MIGLERERDYRERKKGKKITEKRDIDWDREKIIYLRVISKRLHLLVDLQLILKNTKGYMSSLTNHYNSSGI